MATGISASKIALGIGSLVIGPLLFGGSLTVVAHRSVSSLWATPIALVMVGGAAIANLNMEPQRLKKTIFFWSIGHVLSAALFSFLVRQSVFLPFMASSIWSLALLMFRYFSQVGGRLKTHEQIPEEA